MKKSFINGIQVAILRHSILGKPCGIRVRVELAEKAAGLETYKVWAGFSKTEENYLGVLTSNHLG